MFRPTAFIAQEWAYYILVGERVITDLNSGERVTLQVPAETRTLVVHCPKAMGGYEASRIERTSRVQKESHDNVWMRYEFDPSWCFGYDVFAEPIRETKPKLLKEQTL